jgi:hypothetical protein
VNRIGKKNMSRIRLGAANAFVGALEDSLDCAETRQVEREEQIANKAADSSK